MIRPAIEQDLDALVPLLHQLFSIEEDFLFDADKQRRGLRLLLQAPGAVIMVAMAGKEEDKKTDAEQLVGMVTGQLLISTAEGEPALLLEDLVVAPAHQGQGVGKALLQAVGTWGTEHGAKRIQLLADQENHPALRFYESQGWQRTQLVCLRTYHHSKTLLS